MIPTFADGHDIYQFHASTTLQNRGYLWSLGQAKTPFTHFCNRLVTASASTGGFGVEQVELLVVSLD